MKLNHLIAYLQELADLGNAEVTIQKKGIYDSSVPTTHPITHILHRYIVPPAGANDSAKRVEGEVNLIPQPPEANPFAVIIVFDEAVR